MSGRLAQFGGTIGTWLYRLIDPGKHGRFLYLEVFIPIVLVFVIYFPAGYFLIRGDHFLFEKVFGTADFLSICLAVFLSTFVELDDAEFTVGRTVKKSQRTDFERRCAYVRLMKAVLFFVGLVTFVLYIVIKIDMLQFDFPKSGELSSRVYVYSRVCFWALPSSVLICCIARKISAYLRALL